MDEFIDPLLNPWSLARIAVTVKIGEGRWVFRSIPVDPVVADMLCRDLADGPFRVLSAHKEPLEGDDARDLG